MTNTAKKHTDLTAALNLATDSLDANSIRKNRKEKHFYAQKSLVACDTTGKLREVAVVRFYGTQAVSYCCVWIWGIDKNIYMSGGGKASGYGYHRASAALQDALFAAGISLSQPIDGRGDGIMDEALYAIGNALGYTGAIIIDAHA